MKFLWVAAAILAFLPNSCLAGLGAMRRQEGHAPFGRVGGSGLPVAKQEEAKGDAASSGLSPEFVDTSRFFASDTSASTGPAPAATPVQGRKPGSAGDASTAGEEGGAPPRNTDAPVVPREIFAPRGGYELVHIPAGDFLMGSPDGEGYDNERPRHVVYLDGYYIGKYEVTVGQFRHFCQETGREMSEQMGHADADPVISVTWHDAVAYCAWAGMRLPTEAEWEKAARGRTSTTYWWGDVASHNMANYTGKAGTDIWDDVSPVGKFPPNAYGLYDASGNVWEWVQDRFSESYYGSSPHRNPAGPDTGENRSLRGGSWDGPADFMRSARRAFDLPDYESDLLGFRCAKSD